MIENMLRLEGELVKEEGKLIPLVYFDLPICISVCEACT